jgi:beta-N-acetylhexosaminidase
LVGHLVNGAIDRTQCRPGRPDDPRTWCPASLSRRTVTELLRGELGFTGVIAADDLAMAAIARDYSLELTLERGIDLIVLGNHARHATARAARAIPDLVESGRVDAERIRTLKRRTAALQR